MKTKLLLGTLITLMLNTLNAQVVSIPDTNFKAALVGNTAINTNGDTEIQTAEATAYTGIMNVASQNISDFTGLEAFTEITELYCQYNPITTIDVSSNIKLILLDCVRSNLNAIDITKNVKLTAFYGSRNKFTTIDVSKNLDLEDLRLDDNPDLTAIDVTNNIKLKILDLLNNLSMTSLDVSQNTQLEELNCAFNNITTLDVSNNGQLKKIDCANNQLISLDVSNNTELTRLVVNNNLLTSLNVANGNNSKITTSNDFGALNNPNLTCITIDDVAYSTNTWTNIDAQTNFSTNCNAPCVVTIPDANFKAALVGNTTINTNGDTEIQCSEASAFTGGIAIGSNNISDVTGIEEFTKLTEFFCDGNQLTNLDLSKNTFLTRVWCFDNQLTSIDISKNTDLIELSSSVNNLTTLDISNNTKLEILSCDDNQLINLDTSTNIALRILALRNNKIEGLDLSKNIALTRFFGNDNKLKSLNIANGNNNGITIFRAFNNSDLACITVDDVAYSTTNWTNIDSQTSFSTNCVLSIDDVLLQDVNIYPNPVGNILKIQILEIVKKVEVYNLQGQKVLETNKESISVEKLSIGTYLLKIYTNNGKVGVKRFVKE